MRTTLTLLALALAMSAHAGMSVHRHRTFNAEILNYDAYRYAIDLDATRYGTHTFGYRAGDRLLLRGSRLDYNGIVIVESVVPGRDIINVRYAKPRSQRPEIPVRLRITKVGR